MWEQGGRAEETGPLTAAVADGEPWVRQALVARWGTSWAGASIRPLTAGGDAPLTHTAGLWLVARDRREYVLKVGVTDEADREDAFHCVKADVLAHCREVGVPVATPVPALSGGLPVRHEGRICELTPRYRGRVGDLADRRWARAAVRGGLLLRAALDRLPAATVEALRPMRPPALVEEEHWPTALADAQRRLLPLAEARGDSWGRAVVDALRPAVEAGGLLRDPVFGPSAPGSREGVVHGDLHAHHFVLDEPDGRPPEVVAVLDFDNLQVADRLLDLAWLADCAGRVSDTAERRRAVTDFRTRARQAGLLTPSEERRLMPLLMAHSLPVVVDIAKDVLDRNLLDPLWLRYLDVLSPSRRLAVHALLTDR
ncbi:phosphotransferase enzyme family protein [Streptomyces alkaliterrae]|uniref:Phosphotransferase n=1 Tax=Streptomyces alkaliterrae TaxID=2213162 RepID=A0A5P0YR27_9ACTN|nr:phosphotransferase [Streptomyces alkaliterrae]MBB1253291.1 phosphotransferase [Streptomyces alkaliterrae]MBB1259585.1 phosphotransferase [Streptomyces alkaliterrae]MQS00989.1 phosphotransferase [Streptomyces alkaliterrae]